MAVDLRSNSMFQRLSLVLEGDALIKLEHERTKDRVRKVMLDRVEAVVVWREVPWVRVVVVLALLLAPGLLLMLAVGGDVGMVIGALFLVTGGVVTAWYLYCRKTTIRIVRAGKVEEIVGIFWPGKVKRFVGRFVASVRAQQAAGRGEVGGAGQ